MSEAVVSCGRGWSSPNGEVLARHGRLDGRGSTDAPPRYERIGPERRSLMWRRAPRPHQCGGRRLIRRAAVASLTIMALVAAFTGGLVWAADPDFSSVSDILGGKRYLLRQDDLVFTSTQVENSLHETAAAILQSNNSTVNFTQIVPWGFPGGLNSAQGDSRTAVGRMFNLPNDVVATFTQPGLLIAGVSVYDPVTRAVNFTAGPYAGNGVLAVDSADAAVMADFTGDGYADVVTMATSRHGRGRAAPPESPSPPLLM